MTTPTVQSTNGAVSATSNSTTYTAGGYSAASVETGDRVYSFVTADGNGTLTTATSGWAKLDQETNNTTVTQALFWYDVTDGSVEVPTIVVDNTASEQYSHQDYLIRPTSGKTLNHITPTKANGSSTNSNPPSFTNNSGASQDFLVLVSRGGDGTTVATVAPTNYTNLTTQAGGGANGASTNTARRSITVANSSSEDPGTFTSNNEQWACFTVGIYETAAGDNLQPSLFTNTQIFHAPSVTVGAVALTPGLFTNTQTFFAPTVSIQQFLSPSLFTNTQTFHAPAVAAVLTASLFTNSQIFHAPTVTRGAVTLTPSLFTNSQAFHAPIVTSAQVLTPSLFTNSQSFPASTVSSSYTLTPALFSNTQAFYSPVVAHVLPAQVLTPAMFANSQIFYRPAVWADVAEGAGSWASGSPASGTWTPIAPGTGSWS